MRFSRLALPPLPTIPDPDNDNGDANDPADLSSKLSDGEIADIAIG